jgi:hypothetical protein
MMEHDARVHAPHAPHACAHVGACMCHNWWTPWHDACRLDLQVGPAGLITGKLSRCPALRMHARACMHWLRNVDPQSTLPRRFYQGKTGAS